jgi:hypothetical protein
MDKIYDLHQHEERCYDTKRKVLSDHKLDEHVKLSKMIHEFSITQQW